MAKKVTRNVEEVVKRILVDHDRRLSDLLDGCLGEFFARMAEENLVCSSVTEKTTSYGKVMRQFKASLSYCENVSDIEKKCITFLNVLRNIGEPVAKAARVLHFDWREEIEKEFDVPFLGSCPGKSSSAPGNLVSSIPPPKLDPRVYVDKQSQRTNEEDYHSFPDTTGHSAGQNEMCIGRKLPNNCDSTHHTSSVHSDTQFRIGDDVLMQQGSSHASGNMGLHLQELGTHPVEETLHGHSSSNTVRRRLSNHQQHTADERFHHSISADYLQDLKREISHCKKKEKRLHRKVQELEMKEMQQMANKLASREKDLNEREEKLKSAKKRLQKEKSELYNGKVQLQKDRDQFNQDRIDQLLRARELDEFKRQLRTFKWYWICVIIGLFGSIVEIAFFVLFFAYKFLDN